MSVEKEAAKLFQQWQHQQNILSKNNNFSNVNNINEETDQSPHLHTRQTLPTGPDQSPPDPVNSVRKMQSNDKKNYVTFKDPNACRQCGVIHPPIREGEKCPNASIISNKEIEAGIDDIIVNKNLVNMRNIIISQMSNKGIKDGKKFFAYAIVELTMALERYNE